MGIFQTQSPARRVFLKALAVAAALPFTAGATLAQEFPAKPITIYVAFAPGDNTDVMTRILADKAEDILGQPISVINHPGGAGTIALGILANDQPDGYTLATIYDGSINRAPLMENLDYNPEDFIPITQIAASKLGVVVMADKPWQTFGEFVAYAKENSGRSTYGSAGAGSPMDMALQYVAKQEGFDWTHVPHRGSRAALAAMMGGHIDSTVGSTQWAADVQAGTMRLLAVIGDERMDAFPDVPTFQELGYDFNMSGFSMIVAPAGTPDSVIDTLDNAFRQAMDDPEFVEAVNNMVLEPRYRGHDDLAEFISASTEENGRLIEELGVLTEKN